MLLSWLALLSSIYPVSTLSCQDQSIFISQWVYLLVLICPSISLYQYVSFCQSLYLYICVCGRFLSDIPRRLSITSLRSYSNMVVPDRSNSGMDVYLSSYFYIKVARVSGMWLDPSIDFSMSLHRLSDSMSTVYTFFYHFLILKEFGVTDRWVNDTCKHGPCLSFGRNGYKERTVTWWDNCEREMETGKGAWKERHFEHWEVVGVSLSRTLGVRRKYSR